MSDMNTNVYTEIVSSIRIDGELYEDLVRIETCLGTFMLLNWSAEEVGPQFSIFENKTGKWNLVGTFSDPYLVNGDGGVAIHIDYVELRITEYLKDESRMFNLNLISEYFKMIHRLFPNIDEI